MNLDIAYLETLEKELSAEGIVDTVNEFIRFAVRELTKQSEDLQRLKEAETLDRDFLEWLRTSFGNNGRSKIDLS